MKRIYLSVKSFNSLNRDPDGSKVQRVWIPEYKGLGIDVGKTKKSLIYKFKSPQSGKFRVIVLDSYSNTQIITDDEIENVVDDYYQLRRKIRNGVDPLADKEQARTERKEGEQAIRQAKIDAKAAAVKDKYTLNRAFDDYQAHKSFKHDIKETTQKYYLTNYRLHVEPTLGKKSLADIDPKKDVNVLLDSLKDSACHGATAVLMQIQAVAIHVGKLERPFCFGQKKRHFMPRERIVDDLPAYIRFLKDNELDRSYKNALMSQLLHGTRATEIFGLKWEEVDEVNGVINIPWQRVKTRSIKKKTLNPLVIPILPAFKAILSQQKGMSEIYVFPLLSRDAPFSNSIAYYTLKRNGFHFSSHDVRRTFSTEMEELDGVSIEDVDILLDHVISGVNKAYIIRERKKLLQRKIRLLSIWHTYLVSISTAGVTTLKVAFNG